MFRLKQKVVPQYLSVRITELKEIYLMGQTNMILLCQVLAQSGKTLFQFQKVQTANYIVHSLSHILSHEAEQ